jgi:hypothetical protein
MVLMDGARLSRHTETVRFFVKVYNEKASPFEWKKAVVFPLAPKTKYSDLCM